MQPSIFTKIINREIPAYIIYEDDQTIAFLDVTPVRPGHLLVVPKEQVDQLWDINDEKYENLLLVTRKVALRMRAALNVERISMVVEGYGVPHAHVHLIPIEQHLEGILPEHWAHKEALQTEEAERMVELLQF